MKSALPYMVPCMRPAGKELNSRKAILSNFGECRGVVTGRSGDWLRHSSLSDLVAEWFSHKPSSAHIEVCHWPLPNKLTAFPDPDDPLGIATSSTFCLLDIYRQPWFPHWEWLVVGSQATKVSIHQDFYGTGSWNLLIEGKKERRFWSRECGKEAVAIRQRPELEFTQLSGDLIWIPEMWWHEVNYLAPSIAVTKNVVRVLPAMSGSRPGLSYGSENDPISKLIFLLRSRRKLGNDQLKCKTYS